MPAEYTSKAANVYIWEVIEKKASGSQYIFNYFFVFLKYTEWPCLCIYRFSGTMWRTSLLYLSSRNSRLLRYRWQRHTSLRTALSASIQSSDSRPASVRELGLQCGDVWGDRLWIYKPCGKQSGHLLIGGISIVLESPGTVPQKLFAMRKTGAKKGLLIYGILSGHEISALPIVIFERGHLSWETATTDWLMGEPVRTLSWLMIDEGGRS